MHHFFFSARQAYLGNINERITSLPSPTMWLIRTPKPCNVYKLENFDDYLLLILGNFSLGYHRSSYMRLIQVFFTAFQEIVYFQGTCIYPSSNSERCSKTRLSYLDSTCIYPNTILFIEFLNNTVVF